MSHDLKEMIEDHALERVPDGHRQGWLALSWNTASIVTTLVQIFFGALVTFVAGFRIALAAGILVTVIGALLGWACGHVAFRSGLSSTVLSRHFGFGARGSIISSLIYGFMIIGFLALENALLYHGFLFYFRLQDTLTNAAIIYGALTLTWILLTAYGFNLIVKVSSITLTLFLLVLLYMTYVVVSGMQHSSAELFSFGSQLPAAALAAMHVSSDADKFIFAVNVLIGSAGALALTDADIGRFARRSRDIAIAALIGNIMMDIIMLCVGGIIMYAGVPALVDFYVGSGMSLSDAHKETLASPHSIAAAFVVFGGALGAILMVLAQGKAQVLNTYSASLSLSNLADALHWRPGRLTFVILANIIGLFMLTGHILALVNSWITILGVLTTSFSGVIVADYYIVRKLSGRGADTSRPPEAVNWAGVVTVAASVTASHYLLPAIVPIEFFATLAISFLLYPALRLSVWKSRHVLQSA
ncbi:MAG: cytosine permease [Alphaproteobacteria bacterium]|nr:cytosine permease [Alphaproteobacteria bacterium]